MVRLLHACARSLRERGMIGIFADGLRLNDYTLESQGEAVLPISSSPRLNV